MTTTGRDFRVLVVDDEAAMREVLRTRLEQWGFEVRTADCVAAARQALLTFDAHVVITDLVLPDATGIALLESLRSDDAERTVLLITAYGTIDVAVQAIKAGAADFLTKPLDYVALRRQLESIEARHRSSVPADSDRSAAASSALLPVDGMVGQSPAIEAMRAQIRLAASSDAPVLIVGESGTGKELAARTIHRLSARSEQPFVAVNAAAVPENLAEGEFFGYERGAFTGANQARAGLFETAHRGTLFLDEFTEMNVGLQSKFLRVLEDGQVRRVGGRVEMACDARIVAATNRNPADAVAEGRLRHDLLYRLDVLRVAVPSLRDRPQDIPALVLHFVEDCATRYGAPVVEVQSDAMTALMQRPWPGNIRELRNVIERAFLAAQNRPIGVGHLDMPDGTSSTTSELPLCGIVIPHGVTAAEAERILILETLKATANNKAEAARRLGLDVKTVRNKLKAFGIAGSGE